MLFLITSIHRLWKVFDRNRSLTFIFSNYITSIRMSSENMALDLILRTLMNSPDFRKAENKNWEAVAKLVPGSTSDQV